MFPTLTFEQKFPNYVPGLWDKKRRLTKPSIPFWLLAPGFLTDFLRLIVARELKKAGSHLAQPDNVRKANPPAKKAKAGPKSRKTHSSNPGRRNKCKNPPPKGMRGFGYMRSQYGALAA